MDMKVKILKEGEDNLMVSFPYKQKLLGHAQNKTTEIYNSASSFWQYNGTWLLL
jgi:site-specific recombinase XerD